MLPDMNPFNNEAKQAFDTRAVEFLTSVKAYPHERQIRSTGFDIHPHQTISEREMTGPITITDRYVDGTHTETGRFFHFQGQRFGWAGEDYRALTQLCERIARSKELNGKVTDTFVLNLLFEWLSKRLQGVQDNSFIDHLSHAAQAEIREFTYYIPLCRTFSSIDFSIGQTVFRTITSDLLNRWFSNKPSDPTILERVKELEHQTRAKYQGMLAACVTIEAEASKAQEIALQQASDACALLRFLSPANFTAKIRSFTMPLGTENMLSWDHFTLEGGEIRTLSSAILDKGPQAWVVDETRFLLPGLIEALSDLTQHQQTAFRRELYDSLQIYSRNSVTTNASDNLYSFLLRLSHFS